MTRRVYPIAIALIAAVLGVAGAASPVGAQPPDMKLMPADAFVAGWQRTGTPRAYTSADLYGYIDGGAELFLELGFEQLTIQRFKRGADELGVEIYRMKDATAARAVYVSRRGKETPDPTLKTRHTVSRHQLQAQKDRYYVIINNVSGFANANAALVGAASAVVGKIPADGAIAAMAILPKAGLIPGSERVIRGPYTLQALFTLGDGDILSLGTKLTGVAAQYTTPAGGSTVILVDYPTPAAAAAAFAYLTSHLDSYLKPSTKTATKLVFQDYEKKYGVATVTGARLELRLRLAKQPA